MNEFFLGWGEFWSKMSFLILWGGYVFDMSVLELFPMHKKKK